MKWFFAIVILLDGCATSTIVNEEDKEIAILLEGEWVWNTEFNDCWETGFINFRGNGKFMRGSEDCQISDDSFSSHWGWYIANQHICFVQSKKHFNDAKQFGFVIEHCTWRIRSYSPSKVVIEELFWRKGHVFTLVKQ